MIFRIQVNPFQKKFVECTLCFLLKGDSTSAYRRSESNCSYFKEASDVFTILVGWKVCLLVEVMTGVIMEMINVTKSATTHNT